MSQSARAVGRRVAWLRLVLGAAVVAHGLMLMGTGILVLIHLALWSEPWLGTRLVLASIVPAAVMMWSGMVAFFGIAMPLVNWCSQEGFLKRFEEVLGRESHLALALELVDPDVSGHPGERSRDLEAWVGERALADLDSIRWTRWAPVFRLQWMFPIFVVAVGATLGLLIEQWAEVRKRVETLVVEPVLSGGVRKTPSSPLHGMTGPESKAQHPCRSLSILVSPPSYTQVRTFEVPWGLSTNLVAGSQVEVVCHPQLTDSLPKLRIASAKQAGDAEIREAPLEQSDAGPAARWQLEVTKDFVLTVHGNDGVPQPGRLRIAVVPDRPPSCQLVAPDKDQVMEPGDALRLSVRADDDYGLLGVTLRYQVEGLDAVPQAVELARPQGERQTSVRKELPLATLGAEAGDNLLLFIEVADTNERSGPGLCTSARHRVSVSSPGVDMAELVRRIAGGRDEGIDILADVSAAAKAKEEAPEAMAYLLDRVVRYGTVLSALALQMEHSGELKGEDVRRVAGLAVSLESRVTAVTSERSAYLRRQAVEALVAELQSHVWVLDGLADKLLREHLFHLSGRLLAELNRVQAVGRESTLDSASREAFGRGLRKMQRLAIRLQDFSDEIHARVPVLFHSILETPEKNRLLQIAELAGSMLQAPEPGERSKETLEKLSLAVEALAQNLEGAYAQSVNRLSSTFRTAQAELVESVVKMKKASSELKGALEALLVELETQTAQYFRKSGAMARVQRLALDIKELAKSARKIRTDAFVPVDRKQVGQFREGLKRLAEEISLLRLDEALVQVDELIALTQAMDFSLQISIDYSQEASRVEACRQEQAQMKAYRKQLEELEERIEETRPEKEALAALDPQRMVALVQNLEGLLAESARVRTRILEQQKMFPIFFDRLVPMADRVNEALAQTKEKWTALLFEDAVQMLAFGEEGLARLLELLQRVPEEGGASSVLQAGGTVPRLELQGKGRILEVEKLKTFLEMAPRVSERNEWRGVVEAYFQQLSQ